MLWLRQSRKAVATNEERLHHFGRRSSLFLKSTRANWCSVCITNDYPISYDAEGVSPNRKGAACG